MLTEAVICLKHNSVTMDHLSLPKDINGGSSLPYQQDGVSLKSRFQINICSFFVNQLKVRASYGVLGDDLSNNWNYEWAQGYNYPATSGNAEKGYYNQYAPGFVFGDKFVYAASPKPLPNEGISWYESRTFDIGVDFEGWNGLFGFVIDYFDRRRKNMFARSSGDLPTVVGAEAPLENVNSDRQFGIDLELTHRNKIGDFLIR